MITGVFDLRYDLFDSFSQCLPWADGSRIFAATPWPYGAYRWVRLRAARFFEETTGPPAWCGRDRFLVVFAWRTLCAVRQGVLHGGPAGAVSIIANLATGARRNSVAELYLVVMRTPGPLRPKRSGGVQRGQSPPGGFLVTFCPYKKLPGSGARSPGPQQRRHLFGGKYLPILKEMRAWGPHFLFTQYSQCSNTPAAPRAEPTAPHSDSGG